MMERVVHPIPPVFNEESRILILGSFPSVKSREGSFFYHHPQNRFWKVISAIFNEECPVTIEQKKDFLFKYRIALWDVIQSCEIIGSSDRSIRNVVANDLSVILQAADIQCLFANGGTAYSLYMKYTYPITQREIKKLPSTSPANARFSLDKLIEEWSVIAQETKQI
jgi:hypoxanthine-DNA glycosylase